MVDITDWTSSYWPGSNKLKLFIILRVSAVIMLCFILFYFIHLLLAKKGHVRQEQALRTGGRQSKL